MPRILSILLLLAAPLLAASAAVGESAFPTRQLTIMVPYPPGTNADIIARMLGDKLQQTLKHAVVIENRSGGATVPGTVQMLQAPADGHALLQAGTNTNINPLMGIKPPYDADRDLAPVALVVKFPGVLVVHSSVPAKNLNELIALAKAKPGELTYGSPGTGNFAHLAMEQLNQKTGVQIAHVPFRGLGRP